MKTNLCKASKARIGTLALAAIMMAPGLASAQAQCKLTSGIIGIGKFCNEDTAQSPARGAAGAQQGSATEALGKSSPTASSAATRDDLKHSALVIGGAQRLASAEGGAKAATHDGANTLASRSASEQSAQPSDHSLGFAPFTPLVIHAGQRVSHALNAWLAPQGISMSWEAQGSLPGRIRDVQLDSPWHSSASSVESVLIELLAPFGLQASTFAPTPSAKKAVVIRNAVITRP